MSGLIFPRHLKQRNWKKALRVKIWVTQRLLGLSTEDPTPPLDTPEAVGGLKTRLFEGPKSIGSLWEVTKTWLFRSHSGPTDHRHPAIHRTVQQITHPVNPLVRRFFEQ